MPASIHELQVWKYPPTVGYASWTVVSALVCAARGDSIAAGAYRPRLPDGLTGWVAGRVAFSLFSACTISRMKNRPSVQFGDKIVHSAVFSYGKLYTLKLLCQWTMRCGPEGIARGRIPTSRTRACGPLCRARPSQARRRTPSGVVRHGRPFRARLCRRARRHGRIWAFCRPAAMRNLGDK